MAFNFEKIIKLKLCFLKYFLKGIFIKVLKIKKIYKNINYRWLTKFNDIFLKYLNSKNKIMQWKVSPRTLRLKLYF